MRAPRPAAARRPPGAPLPQTARVATIPASIGGWNARDALAAMKPEDAIVLDNLIPITGGVQLRRGRQVHATGLGGAVLSLMEYAPPSGSNRLFAATATAIHDATAKGAVGAALLSGLTGGAWQHVMFPSLGGPCLVACNGADAARRFDGTAWTPLAVTGVPAAELAHVGVMVNRLWFVRRGTLSAWYLPTGSIAGAAQEFPLGPMCRLGGELLVCGSWTQDGGSGLDDLTVFVTSKGECILYRGSDPTDPDDWFQVGVFRIPEPIGRRCLVKLGPDLGVLTSQGLVTLAGVLSTAEGRQGRSAVTDKISGAFTRAYRNAGTAGGWDVTEYPRGKLLVVNVPVVDGSSTSTS